LTEPVPVRVPLPTVRWPDKAPLIGKAAAEVKVTPLVEVTVPLSTLLVLLKVVTPLSVRPLPLIVPPVTLVVPLTEPVPLSVPLRSEERRVGAPVIAKAAAEAKVTPLVEVTGPLSTCL